MIYLTELLQLPVVDRAGRRLGRLCELALLLLINRVDLMGEYTNSRSYNLVAWSTVVIVIVLTFMLLVGDLRG